MACTKVGIRAGKSIVFHILGIPNPYPFGSPRIHPPRVQHQSNSVGTARNVAAPANGVAGKAKSTGQIGQSKADMPTTDVEPIIF